LVSLVPKTPYFAVLVPVRKNGPLMLTSHRYLKGLLSHTTRRHEGILHILREEKGTNKLL
jgi:hypothetical protein